MGSLEVGDSSMDNAYSKLEVMIRNYTREKLDLDNTINNLQRDIDVYCEVLNEKDGYIKDLQIERDRYKEVHEEDDRMRFTLKTMVLSCEQKMKLLVESLNSLQCSVEFNQDKYREIMDFNQSVKQRQLFLNELLSREQMNNKEAAVKLEKCEKCLAEVQLTCARQAVEKEGAEKEWTERYNALQEELRKMEDARSHDQLIHNEEMAKQVHSSNVRYEDLQAEFDKANTRFLQEKQQLKTEWETNLAEIQSKNAESLASLELAHKEEMAKQLESSDAKYKDLQAQLEAANANFLLETEKLKNDWENKLSATLSKHTESMAALELAHKQEMSQQMETSDARLKELQVQFDTANTSFLLEKEQLKFDWENKFAEIESKNAEAVAALKLAHTEESAKQVQESDAKYKDLQAQFDTATANFLLEKEQLKSDWENKLVELESKSNENLASLVLIQNASDEKLKAAEQEVHSFKLTLTEISDELEKTKTSLQEANDQVVSLNKRTEELDAEKNDIERKLQKDLKLAQDLVKVHLTNGEKKDETIRSLNKRFDDMKKLVSQTPVVKSNKKETVRVAPVAPIPERRRETSKSPAEDSDDLKETDSGKSTFSTKKPEAISNTLKFKTYTIPTTASITPNHSTPKRHSYGSDVPDKKKVSFFGFSSSSQSSNSDEADLNSSLGKKTNGILTVTPSKRRRASDDKDKDYAPPADKKRKEEKKTTEHRKFITKPLGSSTYRRSSTKNH